MNVTFGKQQRNGVNYDKAMIGEHSVIVLRQDGAMAHFATLRLYATRSYSTIYATIWFYDGDYYASGSGKAGGGGYCRQSAAAAAAIRSAGIELDANIAGAGIGAVQNALRAIAQARGYAQVLIV